MSTSQINAAMKRVNTERLVKGGLLVPEENRPFHLLSLQRQPQLKASSAQSYLRFFKKRVSIFPAPVMAGQVSYLVPDQSIIVLKFALGHGNGPGDLML